MKQLIKALSLFIIIHPLFAANFTLSSKDFRNGGMLENHTALCVYNSQKQAVVLGQNINPSFQWQNAPKGTKSFALVMSDPDVALNGPKADDKNTTISRNEPRSRILHWVVINIPANVNHIAKGSAAKAPLKSDSVQQLRQSEASIVDYNANNHIGKAYLGPCGAFNDQALHHYTWDLYALDVKTLPKGLNNKTLFKAIKKHQLAQSRLIGTYTNNPNLLPPKSLKKKDLQQIEKVIADLDKSFIAYDSKALVKDMSKNMTFVNQFGRYYTNRHAVEDRHRVIFDKSHGGHLGLKPPAIYTIEKINHPAKNVVSLVVGWQYPPFKEMPKNYNPLDPMSGIFGIQMVKKHHKWVIFAVQNTPATPINVNADKMRKK